jgi:hypothetical protein
VGFTGVDQRQFNDRMYQVDLAAAVWLFDVAVLADVILERQPSNKYSLPDNSVDEAYCAHFLEHLEATPYNNARILFCNELWRVLKPGAKATVITPHWASNRAYGDWTHAAKPVSEMFYLYLSRAWREANAPHTDAKWNPDGLSCDFDCTWAYTLREELRPLSQGQQAFALANYKDAAEDMVSTWVAKKPELA